MTELKRTIQRMQQSQNDRQRQARVQAMDDSEMLEAVTTNRRIRKKQDRVNKFKDARANRSGGNGGYGNNGGAGSSGDHASKRERQPNNREGGQRQGGFMQRSTRRTQDVRRYG